MNAELLAELPEQVFGFLDRLAKGGQPGHYRPVLRGLTPQGEQIALGFSCFALKLYRMLGRWSELDPKLCSEWIEFIKNFQASESADLHRSNAFLDPAVMSDLERQVPWPRRMIERLSPPAGLTPIRRAILAETKQAIATLHEVGEKPTRIFRGYPADPPAIRQFLDALDWMRPWGAGAQFAHLCAMAAIQAPLWLDAPRLAAMRSELSSRIEALVDPATGAYFSGPAPDYDNLVNGAMKVLTGLDWLEAPIHFPERLIDATLARSPKDEGCHLVDAVYVLHRCARQSEYRRADIRKYCEGLMPMILGHRVQKDGGFSYNPSRSQTAYYGVKISEGLPAADIHGTLLLTWAIVMIAELTEQLPQGWQAIRP